MRTKFVIGLIFVFVCAFAFAASPAPASAQSGAYYTVLQWPPSITTSGGATTDLIYARIYEPGVTELPGNSGAVTVQLGYGPLGSDPRFAAGWTWRPASFNVQVGNDYEYQGSFTMPTHSTAVQYSYTFRFSLNGGGTWTYADLDGNGSGPGYSFDRTLLGTMTVNPGTALPPSSAPVSVAGRVTTSAGRSIGRAYVYFRDETGEAKFAVTNSFGYFRVEGLSAGTAYISTVSARGHTFDARMIAPEQNIAGFDFAAK